MSSFHSWLPYLVLAGAILLAVGVGLLAALAFIVFITPLRFSFDAGGSTDSESVFYRKGFMYLLRSSYGPLKVEVEKGFEESEERPLLTVSIWGRTLTRRRLGEKKVEKKKKKEKKEKKAPGWIMNHVEVPWLELPGWLVRRRRCFGLERVSGFVRYGLADPAATGEICGVFWSLYGANLTGFELDHEPVFDREVIEGEAGAAFRFYPLLFGAALLWFIATRVRFRFRSKKNRSRLAGRGRRPSRRTGASAPLARAA